MRDYEVEFITGIFPQSKSLRVYWIYFDLPKQYTRYHNNYTKVWRPVCCLNCVYKFGLRNIFIVILLLSSSFYPYVSTSVSYILSSIIVYFLWLYKNLIILLYFVDLWLSTETKPRVTLSGSLPLDHDLQMTRLENPCSGQPLTFFVLTHLCPPRLYLSVVSASSGVSFGKSHQGLIPFPESGTLLKPTPSRVVGTS